jgi:hypothetical protein
MDQVSSPRLSKEALAASSSRMQSKFKDGDVARVVGSLVIRLVLQSATPPTALRECSAPQHSQAFICRVLQANILCSRQSRICPNTNSSIFPTIKVLGFGSFPRTIGCTACLGTTSFPKLERSSILGDWKIRLSTGQESDP